MRNYKQKSSIFLISWHKMRVLLIGSLAFLLIGFVFYSFGKTFQQQSYQSSSYLRTFFHQYEGNPLVFLLEQENKYYGQVLDKEPFHLSEFLLELATSINFKNPSSFLLAELPGFRLFDVQPLVNDGESNFFNISNEPIPKKSEVDVTDEQREDTEKIGPKEEKLEQEKPEEEKPEQAQEMPAGDDQSLQQLKKRVYIYHTHNRESFRMPSDKQADYSKTNNITLVGKRLGQALKKRGIGVEVDTTDIAGMVIQRDLNYAESYDVSREVAKDYLKKAKDTEFVFDIHRDAIKRELTTVEIKGKNYARIVFVIGGENKHYKKNLQLATELHERLNKKYKGISRNIVMKSGKGVNGVYNQDLSENALTIEFGGVDNSLYEFYRTAEAFADVFSEYIGEGVE